MFNLLAVDFGSVLLNVLAIIGIIVAGGFIIFFLGDLLISIYDPENSALRVKKNKSLQQDQNYEKLQEPVKPQELTYGSNNMYREVDLNKALEEEKMLRGSSVTIAEQPIFYSEPVKVKKEEPVFVEPIKAEPVMEQKAEPQTVFTKPEDIFAQLRAEEELFKQEKLKAATEHKNVFAKVESKKEEETEEDDFDFDDIFFSDDEMEEENETATEEPAVAEPVKEEEPAEEIKDEEIEEELKEEPVAEEDNVEFENLKAINQELQTKLAQLLAEKQAETQKFEQERKQLEEQLKVKPVVISTEKGNPEELEAHLAELEERLHFNSKELRSIKKEYIPLRKVRKTLENDKKKLRRKEALVAKQKIILYGVNNISEIDQDKAKKLQEDLDLLDGLRLSVQHCEEVIRNSEERYPILETSYNILVKNIDRIRKDIADTQAALERAKK